MDFRRQMKGCKVVEHNSVNSLSGRSDRPADYTNQAFERTNCAQSVSASNTVAPSPVVILTDVIRVALIDCFSLSRDCLTKALAASHPNLIILPYADVATCIAATSSEPNLFLHYSHENGPFDAHGLRHIMALREASGDIPIIVLSDTTTPLQPKAIHGALANGIQGFIPTRTTDISVTLAAIRLVREGGTFVPIDLLMDKHKGRDARPAGALTLRQLTVLSLLRQGKQNKIIAHELGMSESAVKNYIRNIMRKLGATNRTQAVYRSQERWAELEGLSGSLQKAA